MVFDPEVAKDLDVACAIMLSNIEFWVAKNEANESERHFHDGKYWTYNSRTAYTKLFPFWTEDQIKRILKKLEDKGYIISGNWSEDKRDRSKWYTPMHWAETPNGTGKNTQCIKETNNKPSDKKPNTLAKAKEEFGKSEINSLLGLFEQVMGFKSAGKKDRWMAKHLLNNFTEDQLVIMLKYCSTDPYAPRIGSLEKLWHKRGDVIAGLKSMKNKQEAKKEDQKFGRLHDGTQVMKVYGEWKDALNPRVTLDQSYYPEIAEDRVMTEDEWQEKQNTKLLSE